MCIYARPVPDAKNAHMSKVKNDQGVVHVAQSSACVIYSSKEVLHQLTFFSF